MHGICRHRRLEVPSQGRGRAHLALLPDQGPQVGGSRPPCLARHRHGKHTWAQCGDSTELDSSVESHMERILGCKCAKKEVCGKTTPQLQHQSSGRKIRVTCLTLKRHSVEARLHWRYLTPQACAVRHGRRQEKQSLPRVWTL